MRPALMLVLVSSFALAQYGDDGGTGGGGGTGRCGTGILCPLTNAIRDITGEINVMQGAIVLLIVSIVVIAIALRASNAIANKV